MQSCTQKKSSNTNYNSATQTYRGELKVEADETIEPVIRKELQVFGYQYDSVKVDMEYKNEAALLADFRAKKTMLIILTRELDEAEKESLKNDTVYTKEVKVAYDAVALVANRQFDDNNLTVDALKKYFNPVNTSNEQPRMVFSNKNSSIVKYVLNYLGYKDKISPNVYALNSVEEVLHYVENDKTAIGFIPYNYLSDANNDSIKDIYKQIKVLSLHVKNEKGKDLKVSANQSDIATGEYPLKRTVNAVTNYGNEGELERLFVNFLYKEKGARIFLKDGLIPAKMVERVIDVNTDGLKGVNQ